MAIVTQLPNGKYFMCYEIVGEPDCDVHFKMSDDGMDFGDPASWGTRPETKEGKFVGSMPYCLWTKNGGPNGTIILSGKRDSGWLGLRDPGNFLVNYNLGEGPWAQVPMLVSYDSRIHQAGVEHGYGGHRRRYQAHSACAHADGSRASSDHLRSCLDGNNGKTKFYNKRGLRRIRSP